MTVNEHWQKITFIRIKSNEQLTFFLEVESFQLSKSFFGIRGSIISGVYLENNV